MDRADDQVAVTRILVIDDDIGVCELISDVASRLGYTTRHRQTPDSLRADLDEFDPSVLVLDLDLPQVDGVQLLQLLGERKATQHILLISGLDSRTLATASRIGQDRGLNMAGVLQKPFSVGTLGAMLERLVEKGDPASEAEMARSIADGDFIVHYQPKVVLDDTGKFSFHSAEALVRWAHPRLGLLYPDSFIQMAEVSGAIESLTNHVLLDAVDRIHEWTKAGIDGAVSVNLSPRLLGRGSLPDEIGAILDERGIDPRRLILEITESAAMGDVAKSTEVLTRLRVKGIGLSIDDFGTGYSSLVQLYRMPFNELKIDSSFVMDLGKNPESEAIVTSIVGLGHSLGMTVCAEGVETAEAMRRLSALGCDIFQGYYIGRPGPADNIIETFAAARGESLVKWGC
ncbi:MAG: EAL domain-containing response regulator [Alphaproteobacteria bacterium]